MERLQKVLADRGIASRRKCEEYIKGGLVKVNGEVITKLGTKVDPDKDIILFNNNTISKTNNKIYIMLNKPEGYVTTVKDEQNRPTVLDLTKDIKDRIFPIGRLDYETEGLLLLTNDGKLAYKLTHPKHKVYKVYEVLVKGIPQNSDLDKLRTGIILQDGITAPAMIKTIKTNDNKALLEIKIREGKNRQVRRMFSAINHPVLHLKRIKQGNLLLGNLQKGKYRHLKEQEINDLKSIDQY
ncbi:ribosomal large subunit pseudouridine synthase B [Desulfonispora thiosulfatigenes DSM 11270]|uniref:Pseudouridine synthase n=1 Tax=Desulfonispora thiosulfatigenes DSM 11270 TaxID=656914 RepID=A0A1W1VM28_DESTI|nr:pseudouridine synthase [Desulfonispora thiosulfatigenes]SMB94376.1 ribosomal large subunit pseudouridine synthase B [Desulfonispora thiosulfatigenes DSM 11270]